MAIHTEFEDQLRDFHRQLVERRDPTGARAAYRNVKELLLTRYFVEGALTSDEARKIAERCLASLGGMTYMFVRTPELRVAHAQLAGRVLDLIDDINWHKQALPIGRQLPGEFVAFLHESSAMWDLLKCFWERDGAMAEQLLPDEMLRRLPEYVRTPEFDLVLNCQTWNGRCLYDRGAELFIITPDDGHRTIALGVIGRRLSSHLRTMFTANR